MHLEILSGHWEVDPVEAGGCHTGGEYVRDETFATAMLVRLIKNQVRPPPSVGAVAINLTIGRVADLFNDIETMRPTPVLGYCSGLRIKFIAKTLVEALPMSNLQAVLLSALER